MQFFKFSIDIKQLVMHLKSIAYDAHDASKSNTQHMQRFIDDTILENQFLKNEYFWKMSVFLVTMDIQCCKKSMQIECKI